MEDFSLVREVTRAWLASTLWRAGVMPLVASSELNLLSLLKTLRSTKPVRKKNLTRAAPALTPTDISQRAKVFRCSFPGMKM